MAACPDCEFDDIDLDEYEEGDTMSCPECGRTLIVNGNDFADDDDDLDDDDEEEEEKEKEADDLDEEIIEDDDDDEDEDA